MLTLWLDRKTVTLVAPAEKLQFAPVTVGVNRRVCATRTGPLVSNAVDLMTTGLRPVARYHLAVISFE